MAVQRVLESLGFDRAKNVHGRTFYVHGARSSSQNLSEVGAISGGTALALSMAEVTMVFRASGLMTFLGLLAALAAHQMGWVDGVLLARAVAALALVAGLIGVIRLPWDLTFQARNALAQQEASKRRGLVVDEAEVVFARKSASRALLLAIALHLIGAGLAFAGRSILGPELGTLLAAAFLGSMALRPIHAFYRHTQQRLRAAHRDAEVPPPDAHSLAAADADLQDRLDALSAEVEAHREATRGQLAVMEAYSQGEASAWRRASTTTDEKLERVLREFERTVERTQQSGEVLAGIRAFVQLVRES